MTSAANLAVKSQPYEIPLDFYRISARIILGIAHEVSAMRPPQRLEPSVRAFVVSGACGGAIHKFKAAIFRAPRA
jgi:hypothetical protein